MLSVSDFTEFASTVYFRSAERPPATARTVTGPGFTAVSTPNWFTEAMFGLLLVHCTTTSRRSAPPESRTRATCGTVAPTSTRRAPPSIAIDVGTPLVAAARGDADAYERADVCCCRDGTTSCATRSAGAAERTPAAAVRSTRRAESTDLLMRKSS